MIDCCSCKNTLGKYHGITYKTYVLYVMVNIKTQVTYTVAIFASSST